MSDPEHPLPPRRQYPEAYEKSLPVILGLLILAIVLLLLLVFVVLWRSGVANG